MAIHIKFMHSKICMFDNLTGKERERERESDTEGERGDRDTYRYDIQIFTDGARGRNREKKYKSLEYTLGESCISILIIYIFHFKFFKNQNVS